MSRKKLGKFIELQSENGVNPKERFWEKANPDYDDPHYVCALFEGDMRIPLPMLLDPTGSEYAIAPNDYRRLLVESRKFDDLRIEEARIAYQFGAG